MKKVFLNFLKVFGYLGAFVSFGILSFCLSLLVNSKSSEFVDLSTEEVLADVTSGGGGQSGGGDSGSGSCSSDDGTGGTL